MHPFHKIYPPHHHQSIIIMMRSGKKIKLASKGQVINIVRSRSIGLIFIFLKPACFRNRLAAYIVKYYYTRTIV